MESRAGDESETPISAYLSLLAQLASSTQGQPNSILQAIAQLVLVVLRGNRRERLLVLRVEGRGRHRESFEGRIWGKGLTRQTSGGAASCGAGLRFQGHCHRRLGYSTGHRRSRDELRLIPGAATV
jgi:hypothetical protein